MRLRFALAAGVVAVCGIVFAQGSKPMSPSGTASAQVLGKWVKAERQAFTLGGETYQGGKWIEVTYGRPLRRGRTIFEPGPNYGKNALVGAPIWRAGANETTRIKTEVPLVFNGKTLAPGEYSLFIDVKENNWTFVVSSLPYQTKYDPNEKVATYGAYNYTPDKDVLRAPMKLETLPHTIEQLTWEFVDMSEAAGTLAISWDRTMASIPFTVARS